MMHPQSPTSLAAGRRLSVLAGLLVCFAAGRLLAQDRPADPPASAADQARPGERRAQPALTDPELRKKFHEMLARRLENRRRETEKLEQALKMFDEGKSFDEIRSLLPDVPHPGQRGEGRDQWIRRWEEGGVGMQPDGAPGQGSGGPNRGPSTEPPRPLTDDERKTVREILKETAPKTLDKLQLLEKSKPADAELQYSEVFRRSRFLLDLRKRDQRSFELRLQEIRHGRQAGEAAQAIADLDAPPKEGSPTRPADTIAAERKQKMDALREALRAQYAVRTEIMQRESQRMTKEAADRAAQESASIDKFATEAIERAKRGKAGKGTDGEHHPGGERRPPPDETHASPSPRQ